MSVAVFRPQRAPVTLILVPIIERITLKIHNQHSNSNLNRRSDQH